MKRIIALAVAALAVTGCDRGARKDLPQDQQNLVETDTDVYVFPDRFPNIAHRCDGTTGLWTTTDRAVWVIYNDPLCGGDARITIFDNIPGTNQQASGE